MGRCGVVVGRCGSLWVVPCFSNYAAYMHVVYFAGFRSRVAVIFSVWLNSGIETEKC